MKRRLFLLLISMTLCLATRAYSKDDDYTRISRLSYIDGNVSFQSNSDTDWSAASVNMPLEPGDRIYTGRNGKAEVEFDDGSVFRLAENSDMEVLSLKENLIQLRILEGLVTLNVNGSVDFEVDTPAAAFNTLRRGIYRFDVVENGDTDAIVRKGELDAANNEFSRRINSGELLHVGRDGGNPQLSEYNGRDQWDEWNDRRNADRVAYESKKYMPDTVYVGASDLDRYGRWVHVDDYGAAWIPSSIDAYWSPYSMGRWCYRPFYGWTWISYEPWGWLPFHYGRWYHSVRFGWCWLPGPSFSFNFWSPALVTFYYGPDWVSWCPLGPGDWYDVNYFHYNHRLYDYQLARLRVLYTRPVGDPFNRHVRGAFRTATLDGFRSGTFHPRGDNAHWKNIEEPWKHGTLARERLAIKPTAASFRAAPDRPVVRPSGYKAFPAVVRNNPGNDTKNRERFNVITNPKTAAAPSRTFQNRSERNARETGNQAKPEGRVFQSPRSGRANADVQTPAGSRPSEQGGRNTATPRRYENRRNASGDTGDSRPSNPTTTGSSQGKSRSGNQQNPSRPNYEKKAPEQKQTPENSAPAKSRNEQRQQYSYFQPRSSFNGERESSTQRDANTTRFRNEVRQQNSSVQPRINAGREWNNSTQQNQVATRLSNEARRQYSSAQPQSGGSQGWSSSNPQNAPATRFQSEPRQQYNYAAPQSSVSRGRSNPSPSYGGSGMAGNSPAYSAPRQSAPSFGQNSTARSYQAPSFGQSGRYRATSPGGSVGGGYSGGGNSGSQKSNNRDSSGSARGRR